MRNFNSDRASRAEGKVRANSVAHRKFKTLIFKTFLTADDADLRRCSQIIF
jgi:hypothetical protein